MIFTLFIIFVCVVVLITYLDSKLWGTAYTPVVVLVWPFLILLIFDFLYLKINFAYFNLNQNVIIVWLLGVISFWMGGILIKLLFKSVKVNKLQLDVFNNETNISRSKLRLLLYILYPLIFTSSYKVFSLLSSYSFNLAGDEFQSNLGSGLIAHSILLLTLVSILFIVFFNKLYYKAHQVFIIIITLLFSILYGVKSWIIIPLISSFIGKLLLRKIKFKFKHILVFISPLFIFWLIYKISLGFDNSNDEFIFHHMAGYLMAGPIGFSEHLSQNLPIGIEPGYVFTPLINIYHFIFGGGLQDPISNYWVYLPIDFESNVKTFFGTLYIYGGYTYVFVSFLFGMIFYSYLLFFCYSLKTQNAPFIIVLYVFMLGLLFMGWFEVYVIHLLFYEVPIMVFFLYLLFKIKILK